MKVQMKCIQRTIKRVFAGILTAALLLTSLPETVFAEGTSSDAQSERDAIMKVLAEEDPELAKQYPAGLFKFDTLLAEMNENASEPLRLYVVRHGGTEGEVTVNVKFSDYSARYGEDYTARLEGSKQEIPANPESEPILYLLGNHEAEETLQKAYGSYDAMVETLGQEKVDRMEALLSQYQEDKAEAEEAEKEEASVPEESPLYQLNEKVSQYSQGGVDTANVWDTQPTMDAATAKLSWGMMEEVFPGTEVDVTFADGERIKEIIVTPIDNDTSDGERIFSAVLNDISNVNSGIDSDNTASVTMHDDEAGELSKIRVDTDSLPETVTPETGSFDIKLVREDALYNVATANFFAVTDNNVVLEAGKVIFMPGVEEQKVEINTARVSGASSVNLYFDPESAIGCEVTGSGSLRVSSGGNEGIQTTSGESESVVYSAEDSPLYGFEGEGTYSGFTIYPTSKNFGYAVVAGKYNKDFKNKYNADDGGFWDLAIPKVDCSYTNSRMSIISSAQFTNFNFVKSIDLDWRIDDREVAACNRVIFSTNNSYDLWNTDEDDIKKLGGVWMFYGDYGRGTTTIYNDGSGKVEGGKCKNANSTTGYIGRSFFNLTFAVWKTSGGINGPFMRLYGIHVNYKQFKFRMETPEWGAGDNQAPGNLYIVSRDGRSTSQEDNRYALEKISFAEIAPNENYELKYLEMKKPDGSWKRLNEFDADQMTLTLTENSWMYHDGLPEGSTIQLRPVYEKRKIMVTLNTDEHGGIVFDGKTYPANSGSYQVAMEAGSTVTFAPADIQNGWEFSKFDGNEADIYAHNNTRQIEFQQDREEQTLKLGYYNYVITPVYTKTGTNVKINVKGNVPFGCSAPDVTEFSLRDGNLYAGQFLQFYAEVADGYRAVWKVTTHDHTWQGRTFYGEYFDYNVINGNNEIELSFEHMGYDFYDNKGNALAGWYGSSYTAINGQVLGYSGTILNPPKSDGHGGYTGEKNPIAGAVVSMGNYTARTDQDGNFRLYSREEDTNSDGINEQYFIRAYENEDHTVRVTCNNRTQIYVMNTGTYPSEEKTAAGKTWKEMQYSKDSSNPYECMLAKSITTDFYGNGPTPKNFYVLTGVDSSSAPAYKNTIAAMPMSNTTVGFQLDLDNITDKEPVSRVDFKIYDKDNNVRNDCTYSVIPDENGTCILDEYNVYEDGVLAGSMYFNGLLNFHDGDKIYVEIIRTDYDAAGGNPIDFSYGEYDTGVSFYEVPGQGMETSVPDVSAMEEYMPEMPIIGSITPGFTAGPLSIKATISTDSMEFSVGFNVATFTKMANAQQMAEKAKTTASAEDAAKIEELENKLDDGEIDAEEFYDQMEDLELAEADDPYYEDDPLVPAPGVQEEPIQIKEPTAQEMSDPSKFARQSFGDGFQMNIKKFDDIIDNIKKGDSTSAALKDAAGKSNGAIPVIFTVTVGVTVRMVINPTMKVWVFDSATIYMQMALNVSQTFYMNLPAVPIPVYVGFSFTISLGLYNTIKANYTIPLSQMTGEDGEFDPDIAYSYEGNIPLSISIEGFVGVGIRKLLCLELGVGFIQQLNFGFGDGAVGTGMSSFYGYIEMTLVIFNSRWKFAQVDFPYTMYDTTASQAQAMSLLNSTMDNAMDAKLSSLTLNKEKYASNFVGGRSLRSTLQHEHTDTILTDAPNIESQIVSLGNGKALMVYEGMDNARDEYNRNAIFYTIYDGAGWSSPQLLQDDGKLDMGLMVEDMGDKIVISWSSAEKTYQESDFANGTQTDADGNTTVHPDALLAMLSSMDIYAIVLNKADVTGDALKSGIQRVTKDNPLETQTVWGFAHENPNALELEDGRIMLFYTSSDYNTYGDNESIDSLGDLLSTPGVMMYRIYEDGAWSEEYYSTETAYQDAGMQEQWYGQRVADINFKDTEENIYYPLTGYADVTTVKQGEEEKVLLTYVVDTDCNISTSDDRIVCMSIMTPPSESADSTISLPIQLSSTGIPVSGTQFQKAFSQFGEITLITFTEGTDLVYLDLTELFNGITLSEEDKEEVDESYTDADTIGIVESTIEINGKTIPYYTLKEGVKAAIAVKGDTNTSLGNSFAAASGDDGNVYLAWADSDGEEQHVLVSALNVAAKENSSGYQLNWSSPKKMNLRNTDEITDPNAEGYKPEYVMNPSISVDENGNMMIIHNRFDLELETGTNENGKEVAIGKHRVDNRLCVAFTKAVGSLDWVDKTGDVVSKDKAITLSEEYPLEGTSFTATAQICNKGLLSAKEIHVNASVVTYDKNGNQIASVPAKNIMKPDSLDIQLTGTVMAEFDMTQEMITNARRHGYTYKVVMDTWESNFTEQTITAEASVKVGSRLEIETTNITGERTHKLTISDDKKAALGEVFDGKNRYVISGKIHNTGNVESATPEISLEMENKNAFVTDGYDNKEMSLEERLEYLKDAPLNESLINNEKFEPYIPIGGTVLEDIESIPAGESADVTIISKKIPDSVYSDNGASTFLLGIQDENGAPEEEFPDYENFTETVGDLREPRIKDTENEEVLYELFIKAGDIKKLKAAYAQKNADITDPVTWSSSNDAVVTVDETGGLQAVEEGDAVVTAKTDSGEAKVKIYVSNTAEEPPIIAPEPEKPTDSDSGKNSGNLPDANVTDKEAENSKKNAGNAKTGDAADLRLWLVLLLGSGAAICAARYRRRRKMAAERKAERQE